MSRQLLSRLAVAAALMASLLSAPGVRAEPVTIAVPGNMPLTGIGSDGAPRGILVEATLEALRRMGREARLLPMPFARMYRAVTQEGPGSVDVATSVLPTAKRRRVAHYAPTMVTEFSVVAVPKATGYAPATVGDLRSHVIGGRTGFRYPGLDDLPDLTIKRTESHDGNARMALAGRLDGLLIGSITGVWELRKAGLMGDLALAPVAFGAIPLTVALNKQSFSEQERAAFDAALREVMSEPLWTEVIARNEATDLLRDWTIVHQ